MLEIFCFSWFPSLIYKWGENCFRESNYTKYYFTLAFVFTGITNVILIYYTDTNHVFNKTLNLNDCFFYNNDNNEKNHNDSNYIDLKPDIKRFE